MTITRKINIGKILNLVFFLSSRLWFFQNPKKYFYFQKWPNLYERTAIGWIKTKTKFQIFPIFIFRVIQKNTVAKNSLNAVERKPVLLESSIQKHAGSRGAAPCGGTGERSPPQKKNIILVFLKKHFLFKIQFFF